MYFVDLYSRVRRACHVEGMSKSEAARVIERERRMIERRIKAAKFPATKSLDSFDFTAIPSLNKVLTMELAQGEFIDRRENIIALGPSGTGKTHVALGLGLAACQKGRKVRFTTAAALVHELIEAVDDRRLQRLQKGLAAHDLPIIEELGFVPLGKTGAELLFGEISRRYEGDPFAMGLEPWRHHGSLVTSNLPFDEWTKVFGSERLTGAMLCRLIHHVQILETNGESFRLRQSRKTRS